MKRGKHFGVAYYRRSYPKVQRAKQLLAAGVIGKPVLAELTSLTAGSTEKAAAVGWSIPPKPEAARYSTSPRIASTF